MSAQNLYALRDDITGVNVLVSSGNVVTTLIGVGFQMVFVHQVAEGHSMLFDMIADKDAEVAHIYSSPIDSREYTEWRRSSPSIGVVISERGIILKVDALPPEEYNDD